MNPAHIPSLPTLDTQATIQEYFAVTTGNFGPAIAQYFPLAEWREHIPTLPAGTHGLILTSDHAVTKGTSYLGTSEDFINWTISTTPIFTDTADIQTEWPVLALNRRLNVVEVIPHRYRFSVGIRYGWELEQGDEVYHTTDLSTFTSQGFLRVDGGYSAQHSGYGQIIEDENGVQWFPKLAAGGELMQYHLLRRDVHDQNWQWDGRVLNPNQTHLTGELDETFMGVPKVFQYHGQWFRLALWSTRPRLTFDGTETLVAYPVKGPPDLDTPIGGYQTLVTAASGHFITGSFDIVVDEAGGILYVYYTERNTGDSHNRQRVAYNSTAEYKPKADDPATYTAPAIPIYPGGRLWQERAATTKYEQGRNEGTPSWALLTQESSTAAVSQTQDGYRITSGSTSAVWNWGVKSANALNPATAGVLVATWKGLRQSGLDLHGWQVGFCSSNASASTGNSVYLFAQDVDPNRERIELQEYRSSSIVVQDVRTYAWDHLQFPEFACQMPRDFTLALFDGGTKLACLIDGSLATYVTLNATPIGAVVPFIRATPNGGNPSNQWMAWEGFEFAALNDGEHLDADSLDQIQAIIREAVQAGERAQRQTLRDNLAVLETVGTPAPAEHTQVGEPFIWELGERYDGVTVSFRPITMRPGEVWPVAFDARRLLAQHDTLTSMGDPTQDGAATVTKLGVLGTLGKLTFDASGTSDGQNIVVSCDLVPAIGEVIKAVGTVRIRS